MDHIMLEPSDFSHLSGEEYERSYSAYLVCEGGLAICKVCGMGESELDDHPECPGKRED